MERLTERNPLWIDDELWERACEPDCEEIDAVYRKLKDYEDAEEQGLLLRLPCKVGDTVWVVTSPFNVFDGIEYAGSNIEFMQKQQITLSERILENAILGKPYSLQKRKPKPS